LDLSRFTRAASAQIVPLASAPAAAGVPLVLSVGRLVEKKGFETLIRACGLLHERGVRFRCLVYGDGPQRPELVALVRALGLEGIVELPGAILQDDLVQVYRQATLFALACQVLDNGDRDGLPNVLVEAMAMEIPVVATEVSGIPELVEHGTNGFLVPPRSPQLLADHMRRLLEDAALRKRMAQEGRRKVLAEFDLERNTRRVLSLFQETLGLRPVDTAVSPTPPASSGLARQDGSF
jgi:glycosyltransferase involved in cell wall biosynthesis